MLQSTDLSWDKVTDNEDSFVLNKKVDGEIITNILLTDGKTLLTECQYNNLWNNKKIVEDQLEMKEAIARESQRFAYENEELPF